MASYLLGRLAVGYYNEGGKLIDTGATAQAATATWLAEAGDGEKTLLATNLVNVDYDVSSEFADATTRETAKNGFRSNVPVLRNGQITFEMRWLPLSAAAGTSTEFTAKLVDAWQNDYPIAMVFLDWDLDVTPVGDPIYPSGMAANWAVSLAKAEALNDVQRLSVTLSVANSGVWYNHATAAVDPTP